MNNGMSRDYKNNRYMDKVFENENITKVKLEGHMTSKKFDETYPPHSAVVISISSEIIECDDVEYLIDFYNAVVGSKNGKSCRFLITTSAYDNDTREVYEIPEYTNYIRKVFAAVPALLALLDLSSSQWILLMMCANETPVPNQRVALDTMRVVTFGMIVATTMSEDSFFDVKDIEEFKKRYTGMFNTTPEKMFGI